ncbi:hypothetical protein L0128_16340 [candidate division KSB1 bacterium]|nr:hypothetical protein [candidate division KSB1 bacterium]
MLRFNFIFLWFGLSLSGWVGMVTAADTILPLSQIRPGARAISKTVFAGARIEEFELEIIDIVKNQTPKNDLILARLTSPNVLKTGVVAGMSGSPVYIDGKLIGALAYSVGIFTKEPIAGITPIEQMFDILKQEDHRDQERTAASGNQPFPLDWIFADEPDGAQRQQQFLACLNQNMNRTANASGLTSIGLPLAFAGFDPRIVTKYANYFTPFGLQPISGGLVTASGAGDSTLTLEAGSAVAGVLLDGDMSIAATGSVTYADAQRVLAFGHPFLGAGAVSFPMAPAKIVTTVSSEYYSYKMSEPGAVNGVFHQDRLAGVLGYIGEKPALVPIRVHYESPFQEKMTYNFRIADDRGLNSLLPLVFLMSVYNAIYTARLGDGDYHTNLSGRIDLADNNDLLFDNFFAGAQRGDDVANAALDVTMSYAALLMNNFCQPKIEGVDLTFRSGLGTKSAKIEQVWYDKAQVKIGESITLNIFIRPYQQAVIKITQEIALPKTLTPGYYLLVVGSGGYVTGFERTFSPGKYNPVDFNHLLKLLNQRRKNNVLLIQLRQPTKGTIIKDQEFTSLPPSVFAVMNSKNTSQAMGQVRDRLLVEKSQALDWELSGGQWIRLNVTKAQK